MAGWAAALFAAMPAQAASAEGTATATVVSPLSVVAVADLDFGTVAVTPSRGGSVTVSPGSGLVSYSGSARSACGGCTPPHAARFMVNGEGGRSYRVHVPSSVFAAAQDGGMALAVEDLTARAASNPGAGASGQLDAGGRDSFEIGGSIRIPAGARPAHYRAVIEVTASYE